VGGAVQSCRRRSRRAKRSAPGNTAGTRCFDTRPSPHKRHADAPPALASGERVVDFDRDDDPFARAKAVGSDQRQNSLRKEISAISVLKT
jgi:hypothetical protein